MPKILLECYLQTTQKGVQRVWYTRGSENVVDYRVGGEVLSIIGNLSGKLKSMKKLWRISRARSIDADAIRKEQYVRISSGGKLIQKTS